MNPGRPGQNEELRDKQRHVPGVGRELLVSIVSVLDLKESRIQGSLFPRRRNGQYSAVC